MRLHAYQEAAVQHLREHDRSALWLDMGLGKTATVLSALEERHLPALVTAPARVVRDVWPQEAATWRPDLRVVPVVGTPAQRARAWAAPADIYCVSHQLLGEADRRHTWHTLIIDEASGFKNRQSRRWKHARLLSRRPGCGHVWEMTGTPSPNGLLDLWSQIYLLDQGQRLGSTLTQYRERYFVPTGQLRSGVITGWAPRLGAPERIHALLEDIVLSMSAGGRLDLPPISYNTIGVDLPAGVRRIYRQMATSLVADLSLVGGVVHTAASAAVASNRLSQISAGVLYDDQGGGYDILHRAKINALEELCMYASSPVLVFYRYRAERELIEAALPDAVHIDQPGSVAAWNRGEIPVLLAHPASAGHGLNLQRGGHTIVWTSLPWSLEQWQQANKRLLRQGQEHPVVVHVLEGRGTIDSQIRRVLDKKADVQSALLQHLESVA